MRVMEHSRFSSVGSRPAVPTRRELHRIKVEILRRDLRSQGVAKWRIGGLTSPYPYVGLWYLGILVRPPLFQSYAVLAASNSAIALACCLLSAAITGSGRAALGPLFVGFLTGCCCFGCLSAYATWRLARRLRLPPWQEYPVKQIEGVFM